ncbi:hypothetical protein [Pseudolysinimonas sp.]|uniref:hypothetical protein n=1 Tax=Pseudolysinimonas sp. TaxID=2680009 RepID=UPI003F7E8EDB
MRIAAIALVAAAALVLTGCTPGAHPSATPSPKATPVFRSDAEALAAAEKAYKSYLRVSDSVAASGGADPNRLAPYVTTRRLKVEREGAKLLQDRKLHLVGTTTVSHSQLQQVVGGPTTRVTFYTCWDVSAVRVLDANGTDVTPTSRKDKTTLEVQMVTRGTGGSLLLDSDSPWSGGSLCS